MVLVLSLTALASARAAEPLAQFHPSNANVWDKHEGQRFRPESGPTDSQALRLAIDDLMKTFGKRYPQGNEFLARLDLNGVYYPTYACAYPDSLTGRCPLDPGQLNRLAQLTGIDVGRTRSHGGNPGPRVNFDRPELSPCLAKFTDKSDPGYLESLAIIRVGKEMLGRRPRADMPGFQPCDVDCRREQEYATRRKIEDRNRDAIRLGKKVYN